MQNLNKENFWNELHAKYPTAVNHFCKWIDEYKKEVGWNKLFNSDSEYQNADGKNAPAPKFHDLPFDMQNGILARFELELFNNKAGKGKEVADKLREDYKGVLTKIFADLQNSIDKRGKTLN